MMFVSMVRVRLFDMILSLVVLLVQQIPKIFRGERNNIGRVLLDDRLRVMLEDVGQLLRHHDLLGAVDPLFANVRH